MSEENQEDLTEQPLISHLVELRDRLIRCLIVVLVLFLCIFPFGNDLYELVSLPLREVLPEGSSMIALVWTCSV